MPTQSLPLVSKKPGHGDEIYKSREMYGPTMQRFPIALDYSGLSNGWGMIKAITLRERTMLRFMNAVTDKPNWVKKVFDEEIVEKWRDEAVRYNADVPPGVKGIPYAEEMTEAMFEYSVGELRYRAERYAASPYGEVYALPGDIYKSDTAVSNELKLALQGAVRPLEDLPEDQKDWHPGSDGKVLDLVHPSLFPLMYGSSKILPIGSKSITLEDFTKRFREAETLPTPEPHWVIPKCCSKDFQWLPCDVDISGEKPKISSYINNLHPRHHPQLYEIIEDIIAAAIPLWELSLSLANKAALFNAPRRVEYTDCEYEDESDEEEEDDERDRYPEMEDDEDEESFSQRVEEWWIERLERRRVVLPEPPSEFNPGHLEGKPFTLKEKLGGRPLQVIVKLANIVLTPEKPEYGGGSWHVEGMMNEAICATAIYYYSSENVTESRLAFRQQSHNFDYDEVNHEQDHHDWLHQVYGLRQNRNTVQDLGSVVTKEGRLLTFPNILQHQVQAFKLEDDSKPGHRKILALFLVDPHFSIISTADVPPQQYDWWAEEALGPSRERLSVTKMEELMELLPTELKDKVHGDLKDEDFPITLTKAKEKREELMKERTKFELAHEKTFRSVEISLCEH